MYQQTCLEHSCFMNICFVLLLDNNMMLGDHCLQVISFNWVVLFYPVLSNTPNMSPWNIKYDLNTMKIRKILSHMVAWNFCEWTVKDPLLSYFIEKYRINSTSSPHVKLVVFRKNLYGFLKLLPPYFTYEKFALKILSKATMRAEICSICQVKQCNNTLNN